MNTLQDLINQALWLELIEYKKEHQHLSKSDEDKWTAYIDSKAYIPLLNNILSLSSKNSPESLSNNAHPHLLGDIHSSASDNSSDGIRDNTYTLPLPLRREINKTGSTKKRVIYSYPDDFNRLLKMIAFRLYQYDDKFAPNCYAFRRGTGVRSAVKRVQHIILSSLRDPTHPTGKYCLKVDISNYFNSIDVDILLEKMDFIRINDPNLYYLFKEMLTADMAIIQSDKTNTIQKPNVAHESNITHGTNIVHEPNIAHKSNIIHEKRGAMAGTPVSPFFANVYLMELDWYFHNNNIDYFRYSDDILIFADSYKELMEYKDILYSEITKANLSLNPDKVRCYNPGEAIDFLGLQFHNGEIDISENTKRKMKARIKRKAEALRRWAYRKNLTGDKAAKGFIKTMNHKFYDNGDDKDFSWSRWFFPNLTTAKSLSELDEYMQEYIRYCVTGRHYKGNYRITYEQMKAWGYRNLVHEYYYMKRQTSTK